MGVGDVERPKYPSLRRELDLSSRNGSRDDAPTLDGPGSQLIASAAGARVHAMKSESGARRYRGRLGPFCHLPPRTKSPTLLEGIPDQGEVLHLHGGTPSISRLARGSPDTRLP